MNNRNDYPTIRTALTTALVLLVGVCPAPLAVAQTAVFQNGAADPFTGQTYTGTQDTMIAINDTAGYVSNWNFGGEPDFELGSVYSGAAIRHDLIRFDLSSMAGQYAAITGVTLRLTIETVDGSPNTVEVNQVSAANTGWVAGTATGSGIPGIGGQSTWAFRNQTTTGSGTPWAGSAGAGTAGTDYLAPTLASANWTGLGSGSTLDLVFTGSDFSFITDWVNGYNSGLFLKNSDESAAVGDSRIFLYSSEYAGIAVRPELIVSYTATVPEPSCMALWLGLGALAGGFLRWRRPSNHRS